MRRLLVAATAALGVAAGPALAAPMVTITYEAAGVVNSTADFSFKGVETFDDRTTGSNRSFETDFGTAGQSTTITAAYSGVEIRGTDVYGGVGAGKYAVTFSGAGYRVVDLATNGERGINYFGYWLSALDRGNRLDLISDGTVIRTFDPATVIGAIGACPNAANPYCGNPVAGSNKGRNANEPYVFVNFFVDGGSLTGLRFYEDPQVGGYESDNHTVGFYTRQSGVEVPEPSALMVLSLGLIGLGVAACRRTA